MAMTVFLLLIMLCRFRVKHFNFAITVKINIKLELLQENISAFSIKSQ
jgi:hypothetical protein